MLYIFTKFHGLQCDHFLWKYNTWEDFQKIFESKSRIPLAISAGSSTTVRKRFISKIHL